MSSDDDDDCRGRRGHRGDRGHRGPEGEPGPTVSGGLLKFSGQILVTPGLVAVSYLADTGSVALGAGPVATAPSYPVAAPRSLRNLAVNISTLVVPPGGSFLFELLQNGVLVPGFAIAYAPGETGIKTGVAGPEPFAVSDRFDLRATVFVTGDVGLTNVSATIGVE
jgi:hypothetical protein